MSNKSKSTKTKKTLQNRLNLEHLEDRVNPVLVSYAIKWNETLSNSNQLFNPPAATINTPNIQINGFSNSNLVLQLEPGEKISVSISPDFTQPFFGPVQGPNNVPNYNLTQSVWGPQNWANPLTNSNRPTNFEGYDKTGFNSAPNSKPGNVYTYDQTDAAAGRTTPTEYFQELKNTGFNPIFYLPRITISSNLIIKSNGGLFPFNWNGLDTSTTASGLLRSAGTTFGGATFDGTTPGTTKVTTNNVDWYYQNSPEHKGYLYTGGITINANQPNDGTVVFNGVDIRNRATDFDPNQYIVGGGPNPFNITVNNTSLVQVNSSLNIGSGTFTATTNQFTNTQGGGQKIQVGTFNLSSNIVDIGTNSEKIFADHVFLTSANIGVNNTNPSTSFNLTTDELIALRTPDLTLNTPGNLYFGQSSSGSTDLSKSITTNYSFRTVGDIYFQQLVKFPASANLDLVTTNTSNIFAQTKSTDSNPFGIDFIIESGTVSFGAYNNGNVRGVGQVGGSTLGSLDKPLSFSIKKIPAFYSFNDTWIRNYANPAIGGQNADLNVGLIQQNTGSNLFRIESYQGGIFFTDQVVVNGNLEIKADFYQLSSAIAQLTGLGSIALRPYRDSYDIKIGTKSSNNESGVFKIPFTDISTANSRPKLTTQKLIIGQKNLVGNVYVYRNSDNNLVPVEDWLDLTGNNCDLTFEAKDSDILLNSGIKLNTNRRFTLDIGVGQLIPKVNWASNTASDIWIPSSGIIDFVSSGQVGSVDRPLYTQIKYLDRSNAGSNPSPLGGEMNLQNQGPFHFSIRSMLAPTRSGYTPPIPSRETIPIPIPILSPAQSNYGAMETPLAT